MPDNRDNETVARSPLLPRANFDWNPNTTEWEPRKANPAISAGENHIGEIGGNTNVSQAITVNATSGTYTNNTVVGGLLQFDNALRVSGGSGVLQSLLILDINNIGPNMELILFNANPTASTITDKLAPVIATADAQKIIRRIPISAGDFLSVGGVRVADLSPGGRVIKVPTGTTVWGMLVLNGSTPTYTTANAVTCRLGLLRD